MNVTNVGIVIVSHSPKIAEGAADMVRQMVGDSVPLAWTGGNPEGGLGTDVASIIEAIGRASFLGERSIGHMDPGARSSALIVAAICDVMEAPR